MWCFLSLGGSTGFRREKVQWCGIPASHRNLEVWSWHGSLTSRVESSRTESLLRRTRPASALLAIAWIVSFYISCCVYVCVSMWVSLSVSMHVSVCLVLFFSFFFVYVSSFCFNLECLSFLYAYFFLREKEGVGLKGWRGWKNPHSNQWQLTCSLSLPSPFLYPIFSLLSPFSLSFLYPILCLFSPLSFFSLLSLSYPPLSFLYPILLSPLSFLYPILYLLSSLSPLFSPSFTGAHYVVLTVLNLLHRPG